jgi:hypothetical protein
MRAASKAIVVVTFAFLALAVGRTPASAQGIEIGTSLFNGTFEAEDDGISAIGIPSGGFGIRNPGLYASFFAGQYVAIEPQLGFVWFSLDGESGHLLNFAGQFDWFPQGAKRSSPYVFASAGVLDAGDDYSPKSFGGGAGYRMLSGERLALRFDVRYTHYTGEFADEDTNAVSFTVSIGGVFGQR